jgi:O-antigen/teichoic acid export membrane protein
VKGTAIFGGVQVFNILINILRGKIIALFLGPTGMGIASLFTSTINMINQFSSCGLGLSAVKEISSLNEAGNSEKLSRIVQVSRKLALFTGIFAALIAITGAPWLSRITFGNDEYIWSFVALSVLLLFMAVNSAEVALLQGTRQLKYLAKSSLVGSAIGLIVSVPLYYFFNMQGIVPAMIILALTSYITSKYFSRKLHIKRHRVTIKESFIEGKQMFSLGIVLTAAALIGTVTFYVINTYIRQYGNLDDVGFYQAATSITNQYVGLIFTAMAVDYFPRLSAISNDKLKVQETVTHQMEIVMFVVVPLLITIIIAAPLIIRILLAEKFLPIIPLLRWLGFGIFFKAFTYPIGYISFSKGDKKIFFWYEGVYGNILHLTLYIVGYILWGLIGLGIAFVVTLVLYAITLLIMVKIRYDFTVNKQLLKTVIPLFIALMVSFTVFQINQNAIWSYIVTGIILIITSIYSYKELDKRIGIRDLVLSKFKNITINGK